MPMTIGGKIKNLNDIEDRLLLGADKVSINTEAYNNNKLIKDAAKEFGSQCIVVSMDIKRTELGNRVFTKFGKENTGHGPLYWSKILEDYGAGEIFLTTINNEGLKKGFDIPLLKKISNSVSIPEIAHGGAGSFEHVYKVINNTKISGVAIAGFFHYDLCSNFKYKKKNIIGNTFFLDHLKKTKTKNLLKNLKKS